MTCVKCKTEVDPAANYCPACGARQAGRAPAGGNRERLMRIPSDGKVAGVCAGIADYLDVDVSLVRALWIALTIVPGAIVGGIVAYILAWVVMPEGEASGRPLGRRLVRNTRDATVGGVCAGLSDYFGVDATVVRVLWIVLSVLPGAVLGGVVAYLVAWFIVPREPDAVLKPSATHAA